MRKIDHDGLLLCKIQGAIFENSLKKTNTSSEIFIRRFMLSDIAKQFDSKAYLDGTLTKDEVFELIEEEYGESSYGRNKYNSEVLYWIGYLYRYFSYTYELTSKQVYRYVKPKELNGLYLAYHTLSCAQAIERILEAKNISFDIDEQNKRLLQIIKELIIAPLISFGERPDNINNAQVFVILRISIFFRYISLVILSKERIALLA